MNWRDAAAAAIPLAPVGSDNAACCVFAETITASVYGTDVVAHAPHSLWRLFADCGDGWGPVSAVVRCGLNAASPVTTQPPADGRWYRVQAWDHVGDAARVSAGQKPTGNGHTFTCWLDPRGGAGRLIDSAISRGGRDTVVGIGGWAGWFGQFGEMRSVALR